MSIIQNNLLPRLRLIRTALSRRFIYHDIVAAAREHGLEYDDLCGDLGPLDLARQVLALAGGPDFSPLVADTARFSTPDAPDTFNSEPSVGRLLGQLAYHRKAGTVIELGCFVGWATAHLAMGMKAAGGNGRIFAVDYMQTYLDAMMSNLEHHHLRDCVTPIRGMSLDVEVMRQLPAAADIIFLDTSHSYPATKDEVIAYAPRLAAGGCLVLHDSTSAAGVRRSVFELRDRFHVHTFATERSNGVTMLFPR